MKKYLITGLIIIMPAVLTMIVIMFLFNFLTTPFAHVVEPSLLKLGLPSALGIFISRIFSLFFLCILIFILGSLARWFIGKHVLSLTNYLLVRIPLIRSVYKVSRDVIEAIFSTDGKKAFKRPVMVPFPEKPGYTIGFEAGEVAAECQEKVDYPLASVFLPTAPHPISGFLFLIPKKDLTSLEMTNEDALKFLVSCGMIHPFAEKQKIDEHHDFL